MADRCNFYFKQLVLEDELDLAFEQLEDADHNFAADIGVFGIVSGAIPIPHEPVADLTIDLSAPGRSYDRLGQRVFFGTEQSVDCSSDYTGVPTEVSTSGNERWLGIFLKFDRLLSDARTDGNSQQVYFRQDESFQILVRQGAEATIDTAQKVALIEDEILVCDVRRTAGQTQIVESDINLDRRQAFVFATGSAVEVDSSGWEQIEPAVDTVQSAFDSVDEVLGEHFDGTESLHPASGITVADSQERLTAEQLEDALQEILEAFEAGHFRLNESNAGLHRTIQQADLGSGRVALFRSQGNGSGLAKLRVFSDSKAVWITVNADWNGTQWYKDTYGDSSGIRLEVGDIAFLHHLDNSAREFDDWADEWCLPVSSTINSAMEVSGDIQETGHIGMREANPLSTGATLLSGGTVTFRNRFPDTPSSISFTRTEIVNWSTWPTVIRADQDGFNYYAYQYLEAYNNGWWYGKYTAIA